MKQRIKILPSPLKHFDMCLMCQETILDSGSESEEEKLIIDEEYQSDQDAKEDQVNQEDQLNLVNKACVNKEEKYRYSINNLLDLLD